MKSERQEPKLPLTAPTKGLDAEGGHERDPSATAADPRRALMGATPLTSESTHQRLGSFPGPSGRFQTHFNCHLPAGWPARTCLSQGEGETFTRHQLVLPKQKRGKAGSLARTPPWTSASRRPLGVVPRQQLPLGCGVCEADRRRLPGSSWWNPTPGSEPDTCMWDRI